MKIMIEVDIDRIPVDDVSARQRFDAALVGAVEGVIDGYAGKHPVRRTVTATQLEDAA